MKLHSLLALLVLVFAMAFVGCAESDDGEVVVSYDQSLKERQMCGGIAGLQCPEGQKCLIKDSYPDAAGVCVGGAADGGQDCSAVRCAMPLCAEGYEAVQVGGGCCNFKCRRVKQDTAPEGSCDTVADCEGLIHPACVGSWSCNGFCSYACDGEAI